MTTGIRRRRHKSFVVVLLGALLLLSSCNRNVVYSKYETIKDNAWYAKDKVKFDMDITDTQGLHNIYLMVRHADSYPFSNLFLTVTTKYPDGKVLSTTMEIVLSSPKGEWLGSGAGDIFDLKVPIKKNTRFVLPGKYEFTFAQDMRVDPLPMIMDLGFEVEKSK